MFLIAGLGNSGKHYEKTRHNFGFMVLDALAKEIKTEFKDSPKFHADTAEATLTYPGQKKHVKVLLAKPQTFMNNSGQSIEEIVNFYKLRTEDQIWIIHDDLDVDLGTIRIRVNGSSAGQKGIQSIINHLGTDEFPRLRMGIRPVDGQDKPAEDFVLEKFRSEEWPVIEEEIKQAVEIIIEGLDKGIISTSV
jgi:peptidyl-tRNA hydrolase, PTH1 family